MSALPAMASFFEDRRDAGRLLGERLRALLDARDLTDPVVLALPRGGVPVGAQVARALGASLDVVVARKIGAPHQPEFGIGALAGDGPPRFDERALRMLGLSADQLAVDVARERAELRRRELLYRRGRPAPDLAGRTVVLVDDGLATGVTARAAIQVVRAAGPARVILAVPVCSPEAAAALRAEVDALVCLHQPPGFQAVGQWYRDFEQVPDAEVIALLAEVRAA